jgi:hypothetical protein
MLLTERYGDQISLILSSFDRVVLMGTLPDFGHARVATHELYRRHIRIFDFPKFANGIREAIRAHAEALAAEGEVDIEFVRKTDIRKEDLVEKVLARRGREPGLVHILSAMESCTSYQPWHDKQTGIGLSGAAEAAPRRRLRAPDHLSIHGGALVPAPA